MKAPAAIRALLPARPRNTQFLYNTETGAASGGAGVNNFFYTSGGRISVAGAIPPHLRDYRSIASRHAEWLPRYRALSRGLVDFTPISRHWLQSVEENTVQPVAPIPQWRDIELIPAGLQLDAAELWRAEFLDRKAAGGYTGQEALSLILRQTMIDGDILIRPTLRVYGGRRGVWLEFVAGDQLYEEYGLHDDSFYAALVDAASGERSSTYLHRRQRPAEMRDISKDHKIINGVEVDEWGAPAAYWIRLGGRAAGERYPAEQFIHAYRPTAPYNPRGLPWNTAVQNHLICITQFDDAEISKLIIGSKIYATLKRDINAPVASGDAMRGMGDLAAPDARDKKRKLTISDHDIAELPPGSAIERLQLGITDEGNLQFRRALLRDICAGLGLSEQAILGDWASPNFASSRQASQSDRRHYRVVQNWMAATVINPIWEKVVSLAIASGRLQPPSAAANLALRKPTLWQHTGWTNPDANREAKSSALLVKNHIQNYEEAYNGIHPEGNWEDSIHRRAMQNETLARLGIIPPVSSAPVAADEPEQGTAPRAPSAADTPPPPTSEN